MLHLIYQSPLESATLQRLGCHNSVLFFENSLFNLLKNSHSETCLNELFTQHNTLFVLDEDIQARGIQTNELMKEIQVINYQGFVSLTVQHTLIQTWN